MTLIKDLLARYKNLKPTDSVKKEALIEILAKMFGIAVERGSISVANNIIYLKTSTKIKAEVFIHKTEVLKQLKEILGKNTPKDIR